MTPKNKRPQLINNGNNGNELIFTYDTMQDLVTDMKYYFPRLFPTLKEAFQKKLEELYQL